LVRSSRRSRTVGPGRQLITAIAVVAGLAVVLIAAYFYFLPRKQAYLLETWDEAVVQRGNLEQTLDGIGTLAMETTEDLLAPQSGVLEEVLVAPGKTVAAGAPIARIRSGALEQSLDEALAALAAAQRDLEELLALRALDAAVYERRHAGLELAVPAAEEFLKTRRTLLSTDGTTQAEVKRAEADVQAARNALADAEADQQISETRSSFQREDVQSEIDRYATRVATIESELAACIIRSPLTGTVTRVYSERGRFVPQYSPVITVVDFSKPQVYITVPATAIGKIAPMLPERSPWRGVARCPCREVGLEAGRIHPDAECRS
jgi:multidrug efflux pump subunit AcrA (membrane-fusion protein)